MSSRSFGVNKQGEEVRLYTLENENISFSVMDYGATMVSLIHKASGIDVLMGFDSAEGYVNHKAHLGAFVGRTANRIKNAEFTLNGETYHLEQNSLGNNLHGGENGFDKRMYETTETEKSIIFHRLSPDGEMGYPGDLDVTVTFTLLEDGVEMNVKGKALNKDTVFGMTNHNYYNLDGSDSILQHRVVIPAEYYAEDTDDGISRLPLLPVEGTAFDFRTEKELGKDIACDDPQIVKNNGYDHHWAVDGEGMRTFAVCKGNTLELTVESNLPGMHVYTGNFLHAVGKNEKEYHPHAGVCFEPEYIPNGLNYEGVVKPIVRCGETSEQIIVMRLKAL